MANALKGANPSVSKVTTNIPGIAKIKSSAKKPSLSASPTSPLFGPKRTRPVIQSVPTRTPSF